MERLAQAQEVSSPRVLPLRSLLLTSPLHWSEVWNPGPQGQAGAPLSLTPSLPWAVVLGRHVWEMKKKVLGWRCGLGWGGRRRGSSIPREPWVRGYGTDTHYQELPCQPMSRGNPGLQLATPVIQTDVSISCLPSIPHAGVAHQWLSCHETQVT